MPLIYHIAWWVAYGFAALYFIMVIYCFIGICRLKRQPLQEDGNCPDMTVIFAAKDEADNISATMDSLLAQNYPADKMHVIAVNDRSSDATGDILDGYKEKFV